MKKARIVHGHTWATGGPVGVTTIWALGHSTAPTNSPWMDKPSLQWPRTLLTPSILGMGLGPLGKWGAAGRKAPTPGTQDGNSRKSFSQSGQ